MIKITAVIITLAALLFVLYLLFNKRQKPWYEMTEHEQEKKKMMVTGGIIVFLIGLITILITGKRKQLK
jgi:Na+/H+ antiporter NhaD/arsenite permease-like protein